MHQSRLTIQSHLIDEAGKLVIEAFDLLSLLHLHSRDLWINLYAKGPQEVCIDPDRLDPPAVTKTANGLVAQTPTNRAATNNASAAIHTTTQTRAAKANCPIASATNATKTSAAEATISVATTSFAAVASKALAADSSSCAIGPCTSTTEASRPANASTITYMPKTIAQWPRTIAQTTEVPKACTVSTRTSSVSTKASTRKSSATADIIVAYTAVATTSACSGVADGRQTVATPKSTADGRAR